MINLEAIFLHLTKPKFFVARGAQIPYGGDSRLNLDFFYVSLGVISKNSPLGGGNISTQPWVSPSLVNATPEGKIHLDALRALTSNLKVLNLTSMDVGFH